MKILTSVLLICFPLGYLSAQQFEITGKVVEAASYLPLAGATIEIKHRNIQMRTNEDGTFHLADIQASDTLSVSHIGYITKNIVLLSNSRKLLIELKLEGKMMEELVVSTGFEKLPRERATGSFTQINRQLFNEQVGTNILDRLAIISNGVTKISSSVPGGPQDALIVRGISSLTMNLVKPLVIVDNFPYQGDLNNLNPNDVENITFLKDAAAASIWGARAANGVIVITTRKGSFEQQIKAEFTSNVTITGKPRLLSLNTMTSSDFIDMEQFLFTQGYRFYDTLNVYATFSPVYEILFKARRGEISQQQANAQIDALRKQDLRRDYLDNMYRNAVNQQYSFNIRGGSKSLAWILTAGADKNLDNLSNQYNRLSLRLDQTYRPIKNLELNLSVAYSENKQSDEGRPSYGSISTSNGNLPPYMSLFDESGKPVPWYIAYRQPFIDTFGNERLLNWQYYPGSDYKYTSNSVHIQDIHAVVGINYRILPWLTAEIKYRYEQQLNDGKQLYGLKSYFARNLVNLYAQWNGDNEVNYIIPKGDIIDISDASMQAQNIRGQLNIHKKWEQHTIDMLGGAEQSETVATSQYFRTYGYNPDILTSANVDYVNIYPNIISGAYNQIPANNGFSKTNIRFVSFYGNAAYTFREKYTLSASARRDASNLFGLKTNDKWTPLWSAGAAWNISKEHFYSSIMLPHLKLRLTYGEQGNVDPSKVGVTTLRYTGVNPFTNTPVGQVGNFANPQLRWEKTQMLNAGLEFGMKNNRISGSIEWYHKKMTDLYGGSIVDLTAGLGTDYITKNVGNMKGTGIDIQLRTINIQKAFLWTSDLIVNTYSDKVVKLYETPVEGYLIAGSGLQALEGYPVFSYFAYRWAGLDKDNGNPQGYVKETVSTDYNAIVYETPTSELQYIGRLLPRIFGSLGNSFSYKGFSLSARVSYKFGYWFKRQSINYSALVNQSIGHSDYGLRWKQKGDENSTTVPSFLYPVDDTREQFYNYSAVLATRGDHIRFEYINLSYTFRPKTIKSTGIPESLRVYITVSQLGILWRANKYRLDPDYSQIPPSRNYSIGFSVNF